MRLSSILIPALWAATLAAQTAPPPTRIAIIQFQDAVLSTQEGQQAAASLKARFDPKKSQLEKKQADIKAMQDKLQQGGPALSPDAQTKLQRDIEAGGRSLNRDAEDLNAEVQVEEGKIMQAMAAKMGEIIKSYATKNGYSVVLDVSGQATPVLWAAQTSNITAEIVKLYDQQHPVKGAAPAAPAATRKQ